MFNGHSMVQNGLFRFYGILRSYVGIIADSAIIGFRTLQVIFDATYLGLQASYLNRIKTKI